MLIAPHLGLYQQLPGNDDHPSGLSLGPGTFIKGLEMASGIQAEVVGKPTRRYFEMAIERMNSLYSSTEGNVFVVGDDVDIDLGLGARELGLRRILGKHMKHMEILNTELT